MYTVFCVNASNLICVVWLTVFFFCLLFIIYFYFATVDVEYR